MSLIVEKDFKVNFYLDTNIRNHSIFRLDISC